MKDKLLRNWPLYIILAVQACLTVIRITTRSVYGDEAFYRWEGWVQIHPSTGTPDLRSLTSGAPQIYPIVDYLLHFLVAARLLSLAFMVGATIILWMLIQSVLGRMQAIVGCSIFAVVGPTALVGSLATFDAMALFFLVLAAYLAARDGWLWLGFAALSLSLANVTKYASILWSPVVIVTALIFSGWKRAAAFTAGTFSVTALLLWATGDISGAVHTTFDRPSGHDSIPTILWSSFTWIGVVAALAVVGAVLATRDDSLQTRTRVLLTVYALAAFLSPIEQARIHTLTSLDKHVDFGAWFAAPVAAYACVRIVSLLTAHFSWNLRLASAVSAVLIIPVMLLGITQFLHPIYGKTDIRMVNALRGMSSKIGTGLVLVDSPIPPHMIPPIAPENDWVIVRRRTNARLEREVLSEIRSGKFSLIVLAYLNKRGDPNPLTRQDAIYAKAIPRREYSLIRHGHPFYAWQRKATSSAPPQHHSVPSSSSKHRSR